MGEFGFLTFFNIQGKLVLRCSHPEVHLSVHTEPAIRLNPDFSVAQVDLDRRTVVMLYDAPQTESSESTFMESLPWVEE